jgi:hypothetical protein
MAMARLPGVQGGKGVGAPDMIKHTFLLAKIIQMIIIMFGLPPHPTPPHSSELAMAKRSQESNKHYLNPRLNIDKSFGIVFEKKADKRESRPLLFNGRFLLDSTSKPHESIWRSTPLFLNGRTSEAKQMQSSDMTVVEDHKTSFL